MRFLCVGCGSIGKRHIGNLRRLGASEVLVYDPNAQRMRAAAAEFGATACASLDEAYSAHPRAVLVCSPTSLHLSTVRDAILRGCDVFVEKPLAASVEGVSEVVEAVRRRGLVTLVGCNMRFHPGIVRLKVLLRERRIGTPVAVRIQVGQYLPDWHPWEDYRHSYGARKNLGGGVILDAIHELDYARDLLGEVSSVFCLAGKLSRLEIETEDTAAILLRFDNGCIGEVHMDYVQRAASRSCHIVGDEGTLEWDFQSGETRWYSAETRSWTQFPLPSGWELNQMYLDEMRHFLRCLEGTEVPVEDVAEGARVLEIALAAKHSAALGRMMALKHLRPRVLAVVQARMGSTRLPGKALADIQGRPMLGRVIDRVRRSRLVDEVIVATSVNPSDDPIVAFCTAEGIACCRGDEQDVLDRFYRAALARQAGLVVRITADCPLLDPAIVDLLVSEQLKGDLDYVSNTLERSYPDGLDVEVFSFRALERAWREATLQSEREHVTPYIWKHGDRFRIQNIAFGRDLSALRWTVDEAEDLEFVRQIYLRLNSPTAEMGKILDILQQNPELTRLNVGIPTNEGYAKSLREDLRVKVGNP